jgi:hypothetical protein
VTNRSHPIFRPVPLRTMPSGSTEDVAMARSVQDRIPRRKPRDFSHVA